VPVSVDETVTQTIEEVFSSMEGPFVFGIGCPTEEGQAAATAKIPRRRRHACALQMPQTLAEEQHDPPWRSQTDT
jgi:hypothetical protein